MANATQLSEQNKNGTVWKNNPLNIEQYITDEIRRAISDIEQKYPNYDFEHYYRTGEKLSNKGNWAKENGKIKIKNKLIPEDKLLYEQYKDDHKNDPKRKGLIPNSVLIEMFNKHNAMCYPNSKDIDSSGAKPDGGVLYVKTKNGDKEILLVSEVKTQADNPGNALERSVKNIAFFSPLCDEDIFPYFLVCTGSIASNPNKGSYVDRITAPRAFFKLNQANVSKSKKIKKWADTRPISVIWKEDLTNSPMVYNIAFEIMETMIGELKNVGKL
jgi:hypothetical protein